MSIPRIAGGSLGRVVRSPAARRGIPALLLALLLLTPAAAQNCGPCGPDGCNLSPWQAPGVEALRIATQVNPAVVRICNETGNARTYGSGTLIQVAARPAVLTVSHLFREGTGAVSVRFSDGSSQQATLAKIDHMWDLAVLTIAAAPTTPAAIAEAYPAPGEEVQACGWGKDSSYRCAQGRVLGYVRNTEQGSRETLELTGSVREGDSGGPVFNQRGEIVAVCWGTDGRTVLGTFCGRIRRFLGVGLCPPRARPPRLEPLVPVLPPDSPTPPTPDCCAELRLLVQANAQAIAVLAEAAKIPGPPGPKGEPGPPGEGLDIDALTASVLKRLPPVRLQTVKVDGTVIHEATAPLGKPLKLRLVPVAKGK